MIASAHGDLRGLVKNPELRGLVGNVTQVTLGDQRALREAQNLQREFQKVKTQRAGPPTFDIIVEVSRRNKDNWRIIPNTAKAVDAILEGSNYKVERRIQNPLTGDIQLVYEDI